jgi:hypothetical protein
MATLAGSTIASTYTYLLKMDGTSGLTSSLVAVQDGDATDSALKISTTSASVAHTVTTATSTPKALFIDANTSGVAAQDATGLHIDFDRTVAGSGTAAHNDIGINLDVNSASLGTSSLVGMDIDVVGATSGTSTATGLAVTVGSADTNYAALFTGGNVGIGTTSPAEALHIYNSDACIRLENSGSTGIAEIYTNNQAGLIFDADPANGDNGTPIVFKTDSNEVMRLTNSGYVGIGTDSPWGPLSVEYTDNTTVTTGGDDMRFIGQTIENKSTTALAAAVLNFRCNGSDSYIAGYNLSGGGANTGGLAFFTDSGTPSEKMRITNDGQFFMNETANGTNSRGLTINQGAFDDEILSFKSSDCDHPFTDEAETDTYGLFGKHSGANSGLWIRGITEGTYGGVVIQGSTEGTTNTLKNSSGYGAVTIDGTGSSSATTASVGSNGNIVSIRDNGTTRFIFDAEGQMHATVSSTTFDAYDDAQLVRAYDISHGKGMIESKFDQFIDYNHETLAELKLVGREEDGTPNRMVNVTGMQHLHNGAIWQQYTEMQKMKELMYDTMVEMLGKEKADAKLKDHDIKLLDNKTLLN